MARKTKAQLEAEQYETAVAAAKKMTKTQVKNVAQNLDGHTIFNAATLQNEGLPEAIVVLTCKTIKSSRTNAKEIVFNDRGEPLLQVRGIYGLDLLRFLARARGVKYEPKMGRGFEARSIQRALGCTGCEG